jgi:hypothetical protein
MKADFVRSIPEELREEVLLQLPRNIATSHHQVSEHSTSFNNREVNIKRRNINEVYPRLVVLDEDGDEEVIDKKDSGVRADSTQQAGRDVPPAPSTILPHCKMTKSSLRDLLHSWTILDQDELTTKHLQALSSYSIWLVRSKQLDQVGTHNLIDL